LTYFIVNSIVIHGGKMVKHITEEEKKNAIMKEVSDSLMNLVNCSDIETIRNSYNFLKVTFREYLIESGISVPNGYYASQFMEFGRKRRGQYKAYEDERGKHYFVSDFWKLIITEQLDYWLRLEKEHGLDIIDLANRHLELIGEGKQKIDKVKLLKRPYYNNVK